MTRTAIVAITKHGIDIARKIKQKLPEVVIYVPSKHNDGNSDINWFTEPSTKLIGDLFKACDGLICIFSLGAVVRMIAPHLGDKKSDPAVLVIDDKATHVISVLSGHLGGANALARLVASHLGASPVITTAADVNETIAVDLLGREFGWMIENFDNVTRTSASMVNEEQIVVYQDAGETNWWNGPLPKNVALVGAIDEIKSTGVKAGLIITDRVIADPEVLSKSVIYRPRTLVIGIGLHWDTTKDEIKAGLTAVLKENNLSMRSIRSISSINRGAHIKGLDDFAKQSGIPLEIHEKEELAKVEVPNPSATVQKFEGTPSVSEASSILSSKGVLIVPKQKFPPNLTVAVSRMIFPQR